MTFSLDDFSDALERFKPVTLLFVTHGESSTGVKQGLEGLGELCRR